MLLPILFLLAGIAVLIVGAELLVRGASSIALRMGISTIVIGLTVVAFGTSAPELVVNMLAAINGNTGIAIGNIVGSNLANILLILGIGAIIAPLKVKGGTTFKEIPFALLGILFVGILGNDIFFNGSSADLLTRSDGIVFIAFFAIFMYYTYGLTKVKGDAEPVETYRLSTSWLMFFAGIGGLVYGGQLIVNNAITLASLAGLSESLIGLTIVAIGTSLPELATTVVAVRKGNSDLAIGNAIGSNIFNVFWILGLTAIISPLEFNAAINTDVIMTSVATLLLFAFMFIHKRYVLQRWQGVFFVVLYLSYLSMAIMRG